MGHRWWPWRRCCVNVDRSRSYHAPCRMASWGAPKGINGGVWTVTTPTANCRTAKRANWGLPAVPPAECRIAGMGKVETGGPCHPAPQEAAPYSFPGDRLLAVASPGEFR